MVAITPDPIETVFFADSGSVSVEIAIKMAMQYWIALGRPEKNKMLTVRGGYYGDTTGGMSVCDPENGNAPLVLQASYRNTILHQGRNAGLMIIFEERHIKDMVQILGRYSEQLAGIIIEPIVQGAGGMHFYSPEYLVRLRTLCDNYEVLLIHDEIATGFGRYG